VENKIRECERMKITFRRTNEVETSFEVLLEQSEEQKLKVLCLHVSPHVFSRFIIIRCTFSLTFFFFEAFHTNGFDMVLVISVCFKHYSN
jgi:hypothetical protein